MPRRLRLLIALAATLASGLAFAQGRPATLQIDSGSAMVSADGPFVTVATGAEVRSGNRLMLTEGSRVTVVYSDGCARTYAGAGVFEISDDCVCSNDDDEDDGQQDLATVQITRGSAMVSIDGGEFTAIETDARVPVGSRLMLAEDSQVTLYYPNGCSETFSGAGVYDVTGTCFCAVGFYLDPSRAAQALGAAAIDFGSLGLVTGGTAAAAGILSNMEDVPYTEPAPPALSP